MTELETERMRLATCSAAALGYFEGCLPEYGSAALQDVLRLYEKYRQAEAELIAIRDAKDTNA